MNENELTTVLERAAERLDPDVAGLVAGGTLRGRRRRRRAAAVAALGTAAVLVLGGVAWQAGLAGDRVAQDPAVATSPRTPDDQRSLVADDVLVARLLDHLPDGEVSDVTTTPRSDEPDSPVMRGLEIKLVLDGAAVVASVSDGSLDPDAWARHLAPGPRPDGCDASLVDADAKTFNQAVRDAGRTARTYTSIDEALAAGPTREQTCISWVSGKREQKCAESPACLARRTAYSPKRDCGPDGHQLPDGSWLWPRSGDGGDGSGTSGFKGNWATVCSPDGWMVSVSAFNTPDADAGDPKVTRAEPPLTLDQVTALATADLWFE